MDILEKKITNYLPSGENTEILLDMNDQKL